MKNTPNGPLGAENTNERMADRPATDASDLDPTALTPLSPALDDTALQSGDPPAVDDV